MDAREITEIMTILRHVKVLARAYRRITGKPLGVTGEIAEFEAAQLLGLKLCLAREPGYDAVRVQSNGFDTRIQIKSVCFDEKKESSWRIGTIQLDKPWDTVMMVLLNPDLEVREIWEADRASLGSLLEGRPRKDPGVKEFKRIANKKWPIA